MGITFEICTFEDSCGVGYWKINTSLLNNDNFCKKLKGYTREETTEIENPISKWENLKIQIKHFYINYSKNLALGQDLVNQRCVQVYEIQDKKFLMMTHKKNSFYRVYQGFNF